MRNVLVVLVLLLGTASAETIADPDVADNEDVAMALAIGTTAGSLGVVYAAARSSVPQLAAIGVIGLVVGPSAGHFYAGEWGHALAMSGLRTAGAIVLTVGVIGAMSTRDDAPPPNHSRAWDMIVVGGATYLVATVWDIVDSRGAARRANARLTIAPTYGATTGAGLVVAGRF